ncbi:glycosyltransferase [Kitasatospora sp. RB6PN24]|uniref:glycosyltransferase n=1 Tax=Kitasatospora humi TaxID=2893891 RepID=UPI001E4C9891|nr:glycosyltransferase [Kitasatospora humi]MCC9310294.1 glycosyltransferase [Kitasatospora humi]
MRIQIVTVGTTGSVAPYTGLAHRLLADGHDVELATHARFESLVSCCGLRIRPIGADPFEALLGAHSRRGSGLRALRELRGAGAQAALDLVDGILAAVDPKADLILLSTLAAPIGSVAARHHRIPTLGAFLQPDVPSRWFAPCSMAWRAPGRANVPRARIANAAFDSLYDAAVRAVHRRLGLPPVGSRRMRALRERDNWPIWHGYSPTVLPRPTDWRSGLRVAGYWWPHECPRWQPPTLLADFLAAGPPPVLVGFGSMMPGDPEQLSRLAAGALRRAGLRGIVQSGWVGLDVIDDDIITVDAVPHGWLMPRTAAVVHHAGAGTTAAGLRAGVPAVPVPVMTDQPWWAARLVELGVSEQVISYRELTEIRLAEALLAATRRGGPRHRAASLARALQREDGAGSVADAIARLG